MSDSLRLVGYIVTTVVLTVVVLALCWQPWLGSPADIPSERASSLFASLGQVLLAYFSVVVAVYMSAHEASEQKLAKFRVRAKDLSGSNADTVIRDLEAQLNRLKASYSSFDAEQILGRIKNDRFSGAPGQQSPEILHEKVVMAIGNLREYELSGSLKALRDECLSGLGKLKGIRLRECYVQDEQRLLAATVRVRTIFDITIAVTLVHCILCFWPDPLMSDTLDNVMPWAVHSSVSTIPSGVAVLGGLLILAPMFLAAYLFVRRTTQIYSIGQGREDV